MTFRLRVALGCVIVVLASAATAAIFVLEQVHTVVQDLSVTKALKVDPKVLAHSGFGGAETLLMVGDDTRTGFKYYNAYVPNLANEMLLVRIDPSQPYISMLSVPRELWVPITPPSGATYTNRLNSAYTFGTTTLVKTIHQVTGIQVNHVIATTFNQFETAINTLGCVYATIDERYYHDNADGGAQYQNVNLQPGYQCLNGSEAEQFVSYRHTDTSQVRDARDQAFLLAVKAQYGPELSSNISRFEKIFGRTVQTDAGLRSPTELLSLANLLISASSLKVRQVPFQTDPCSDTCPYGDLTATPAQIRASVDDFLDGPDRTPTSQTARLGRKLGQAGALKHLPLTTTLAANLAAEQANASRLQFTAEFPKVQDLAGSIVPVAATCTQAVAACLRRYLIHAPDGDAYPAYVEVFSTGDLGQYYDVQGTTWTAAPLFRDPQQSLSVGARTYELFYDGAHLETIAWHQYGAVYWVHNTLTDAVGNGELLGIAEQTAPVGTIRASPTHTVLKAFSVPTAQTAATTGSLLQSFGRFGGWLGICLLPLGLAVAVLHRGRMRNLHGHMSTLLAQTTRLERQLMTVPAGPNAPDAEVLRAPRSPRHIEVSTPELPDHRRYRSGARWMWILIGLSLIAIVAVASLTSLSSAQHTSSRQPAPTASVAVLNAGTVAHAAHRLGVALAHQRVHIVGVANFDATAPTSYEVLYRPGDAHQAQLLAQILTTKRPRVIPIAKSVDPVTKLQARLVVVIP